MKYLSVCSGIEAASVAWRPLGWEAVAFAEIEPFPSAVLSHRFPEVPNLGDITKYKEWKIDQSIDILVGGTPCQSFSIAGNRGGLGDLRGQLMFSYLGILEKYKPQWCIWENVPGVLSSNRGLDFAEFLSGLEKCGYGWAYRVLDAQYFGVPQRRRRVFVVGYLGDFKPTAKALFEPDGLRGNPASRRKKGEKVAGTFVSSAYEKIGNQTVDTSRMLQPVMAGPFVAKCLTRGTGIRLDAETFVYENHNGDKMKELKTVCTTVTQHYGTGGNNTPIVISGDITDRSRLVFGCFMAGAGEKAGSTAYSENVSPTLNAAGHGNNCSPSIHNAGTARSLTPRECERLQGFPDDWTLIPYRRKAADLCPDSPRYKAIGNSMAVPVMRWIGERIQLVEDRKYV